MPIVELPERPESLDMVSTRLILGELNMDVSGLGGDIAVDVGVCRRS